MDDIDFCGVASSKLVGILNAMENLDLYKLHLHSLSLISSSRSHPCPPWVLASYIVFFDVFHSFAIFFVHSLMIRRFIGICSTDCLAGLIASTFLYWSAPGMQLRKLSRHCIVCCDRTRWLLCYWPSRAAKNGRNMQTDFQTFCISRRALLRQQVERQTPVCRTC